jgi:signal transduction histidine kinase
LRIDPENKFSDIQKSNLGQISSAGYHLLALINEVLDLSRVESGYAEISFEPVDMVPFVEDVISILKPLADEKGVSIGYQGIPEMSYIVEVDPLRFKQVVLNIVSNAIKYNKPNGTISVSYEMKEDAKVRLGVKDTGYGIPVNQKEKIFNPFERLGVKPEDIEGTGVGLSISKHLVEMMNGTMGFESEFGIGSFFYIDLPISNKAALPNQI